MKYLIIAFKSRNELYNFAKILKSNNIVINIINSPKVIASSCTLSIKTDFRFFNMIKNLLFHYQPKSLIGVFSIQPNNTGNQTIRLL